MLILLYGMPLNLYVRIMYTYNTLVTVTENCRNYTKLAFYSYPSV